LFNFVSVGSVGGDLFKAFFIAREQPGRRTEAVATVVVDRLVGFYALLLVASLAILFGRVGQSVPAVKAICNMTLLVTAIGGVGLVLVLLPGFTSGNIAEFMCGLPRIGGTCERLIGSLRMYRGSPLVMLGIFAMSMGVHAAIAFCIYLIATALFPVTPTLAEHLVIVPLSGVAGGLPFTPAGLGSFEFAMDKLYQYVPAAGPTGVAGVLVALTYRLTTIAIAAVGVVYYWTCRAEVRELIDAAQHSVEDDPTDPTDPIDPTNSTCHRPSFFRTP
jgi:hypothetical protein